VGAVSRDAAARPRAVPASGASREPEFQSGDPAALARAHRDYRARLENVAYRILGDRADAEDVVQQVFLGLHRSRFRGASSLWTYLYRAAVNGAVNVLRSRRRQHARQVELVAQEHVRPRPEGPESRVLEGEMLGEVARALMAVRPRHRRVLVLRIVWGLTNAEIAEREGVPLATVGTWLRRGRAELHRALRPLLRELGPDLGGGTA